MANLTPRQMQDLAIAMASGNAEELGRETVEAAAGLLGTSSVAALALADADSHVGAVKFWKVKNAIFVQKIPVIH